MVNWLWNWLAHGEITRPRMSVAWLREHERRRS
jgi:hypothetical protein